MDDQQPSEKHLCDLPGPNHLHYISLEHKTCYEEDWATATPEQRAAWREKSSRDLERYKENG